MPKAYLPLAVNDGTPAPAPTASPPTPAPPGVRVVIDPVTRIEGHLRIEAQVTNGVVTDAWSSGTMFRGLETVLVGRDPREAWLLAQRMCGVCTTVHALASVRAVEDALGIEVPVIAHLVRDLIAGAQVLQDHVVHFYHLHAPDWVDFAAALEADPAATSALARATSDWPESGPEHFAAVQARLRAFVDSGQTGILGSPYWGHPAQTLSPEADLLLFAHYLAALDWQRDVIRIQAILGGKNPHPQSYLVGGAAVPVSPDAQSGVSRASIAAMRQLARSARDFVTQVYQPDLALLCRTYGPGGRGWADSGAGVGNYLTYGDGAPRTPDDPALAWWPAGVVRNRAMDGTPEALRSAAIGEYVTRSWYDYASGDLAHLHPGEGETQPRYTGPRPPYSLLDTTAGYSWLKSPRYDDIAAEVGPLARLVVGYASGREPVRSSVDRALADLGWPRESLFSTLGRMLARGIETGLYADQTLAWLDALEGRMDAGDTEAFDGARWDPATWPADVSGWGAVEAPRGALGHWVAIRGGRIAQYQVIAPSTWNGSPRDAANRRGPWEEALVGTPVADPDRPLEVLRTVHAFDPCLACAVHVVRARREVMRA